MVEIIVVLVILAILAAATIPSMLGFVNDAKQKSLTSEVRAVYTAAQAYATEHFAKGDLDVNKLNGEINANHDLYYLLQNDATGTISGTVIESDKVKGFSYVKCNIQADYTYGEEIKFHKFDGISVPNAIPSASAEPSVEVSPSVEPSTSPSLVVKNATFADGHTLNAKMKILAGHDASVTTVDTDDTSIHGILRANTLSPDVNTMEDKYKLSVDTECPIFGWYEDNNIYYFTEADNIFLNVDSTAVCCRLNSLSNISGFENVDVSNVTSLRGFFFLCSSLSDISSLSDWDVSNVANLRETLAGCQLLSGFSSLQNWDTSNVTNLQGLFGNCTLLTDATILNSWPIDISKVTDKTNTFYNTPALANNKLPTWYE